MTASDDGGSGSSTRCSGCGRDRSDLRSPPELERPPCPDCGATALTFIEVLTEEIRISTSVTSSLTPSQQDRDWRLRWDHLLLRLPRVTEPRTGARGADEINAAAQDLFEFLVSAYHLKDALIEDRAVQRRRVERAISDSVTLSLLADLANLDKHRILKTTRSGETPRIESVSDISSDDTWQLRMVISHKERELEGVQFASAVVAEWREHLRAWGLIE